MQGVNSGHFRIYNTKLEKKPETRDQKENKMQLWEG